MEKRPNKSKPFKFKPKYPLGILEYPFVTPRVCLPRLNINGYPFVSFPLLSIAYNSYNRSI